MSVTVTVTVGAACGERIGGRAYGAGPRAALRAESVGVGALRAGRWAACGGKFLNRERCSPHRHQYEFVVMPVTQRGLPGPRCCRDAAGCTRGAGAKSLATLSSGGRWVGMAQAGGRLTTLDRWSERLLSAATPDNIFDE